MTLPSRRLHLRLSCCALLHACFFVLPLLFAVSSGAAHHVQQTPAVAANAQAASTATSGTLKFPVTVTSAKGGFIIGLTKENFSVWEGKQGREINYFSSGDLPTSVGILIDVSGSVDVRTLEAVRYAAERFIRNGHPKNEYIIGEFNDSWRASSGWRQDATAAIEALNSRPAATDESQAKKKTRGQTALYDACDAALDDVAARPNPRHVLLLFTDGQDNQSRVSLDQLRRKVKMSDMLIYSIGIYEPYDSDFSNAVGQVVLEDLSMSSGGRAFFPHNQKDKKELDEVIDRMTLEMRHQYLIGFTPANAAPAGKWNKVKIKLTPPDKSLKKLYVHTREGYFSPPATP